MTPRYKLSVMIPDDVPHDTNPPSEEVINIIKQFNSYKTLTDGKIYGYTFPLVINPTDSISFHTGVNKYYFNF